jgi:glycosyltransferase involved in cell wall biosynthesis
MLSILIPSRNERFLQPTIDDLLKNARGEIEIIVFLDHILAPVREDPRVIVVHSPNPVGMRGAINGAVAKAKGEWLMKIDAHCMVSEGFDVELVNSCKFNWVMIPRRKRLDADNWCIQQVEGKKGQFKPDVDYEYLCFPGNEKDWGGPGLHGNQWNTRSVERLNDPQYMIDEDMSFQGSCWFMHRDYFQFLDLMDDKNYGVFTNEAQEIGLKCWLSGGKVMVNKNTWYAHLHKGKTHGRGYHLSMHEINKGMAFVNKWITNSTGWEKQTLPFEWLIEHFWPVPSWPEDWKERIKSFPKT